MSDQSAHDTSPALEVSGNRGQVIRERYHLERLIASGGMGSVWLARDRRVGDYVAVKLLSRPLLHSDEARGRFVREAVAASQLRSRFVVRVYDSGETNDDVPFIIMELLSGETLEERILREQRLPLEDAVRIGVQIARALTHAHRRSIVHRDLKPANVFLHCAPPFASDLAIAKVLDFGIAKFNDAGNSSHVSRDGSVMGTPQYMSPEQVRGLVNVDHRADLYALGMVVFAMLTGKSAFEAEGLGDWALKICTHPLPNISHFAPGIPAMVDAWFHRACAREPALRFQQAQDFAMSLHWAAGFEGPLDQHLQGGGCCINSERPEPPSFEFDRHSELPTLRFIPRFDD
jgi:eukaryotic-like serine/threonine-protein kinase